MDAMITREEFDQAMKRHNAADKDRKDRLLEVQEEVKGVKKEIERLEQPSGFWEEMTSLGFKIESLRDEKKMRDIIHEMIKKTDVTRTKHGFELVMTSYKDFQMKVEYWPRKKKLFINGIPDKPENYTLDRSKLK
jgi:ATP-dependent Lon protease